MSQLGLHGSEVSGDFETHLTIAPSTASAGLDLEVVGRELGLKFISIVLDRGATPVQPMFTCRGKGTLADQVLLTNRWARELSAVGLTVIRTKIEAAPWSAGIPLLTNERGISPRTDTSNTT